MSQMGADISEKLFFNSFQSDVSAGQGVGNDHHHYASFPPSSRFNHDCRPNVAFHVTANMGHVTHAVRDIAPGEELSIAYTDAMAPSAQRRGHLKFAWGFECSCAACARGNAADEAVQAITALEARLSDVSSMITRSMVDDLVRMYEREGLHVKMGGAWTVAALSYSMLGLEKEAKSAAEKAVETTGWESGSEVGDVRDMKSLARNVKKHWSWKGRVRG